MNTLRAASISKAPPIVRFTVGAALAVVVSMSVTGCGQGGLGVHDSGEFQGAAPELKAQWQTAVQAAKTNGYVVAYTTLQKLQTQPGLSAAQAKAAEDLLGVVGTRMFKAANDGDPEATKALKEVQAGAKRR